MAIANILENYHEIQPSSRLKENLISSEIVFTIEMLLIELKYNHKEVYNNSKIEQHIVEFENLARIREKLIFSRED